MKFLLPLLVLPLLFFGCSEKNEAEPQIASFYQNLSLWLSGQEGAGKKACALLTEEELEGSRKYAQALTGGDLCQGVLEENFSFLTRSDDYQLLSAEPFGKADEETKVDRTLEVQTVRLTIKTPQGDSVVPAKAAALVEGGKILNLAGMRLSTLAPEEFAQSLGTDESIPVDPLAAAYYSEKNKGK